MTKPSAKTWLGTALIAVVCAVGLGLVLSAGAGVRAFLDYFAGVISLVSLTGAVLWGVISTDTAVLGPTSRLWAQGVHRGLAVISLGFLVLHVAIKVSEQHASLIEAFVPVGFTARGVLIALGVVAGYLLVLAVGSGVARRAFAARGHPVRWRMLHASSYVSWLAALVHGLKAGRPAAWWVTASYVACLIAVSVAVVIRLRSPARRKLAPSVRRPSSAISPTGRRRARGRRRRHVRTLAQPMPAHSSDPPPQPLRPEYTGRPGYGGQPGIEDRR
ncbi:hypothetical protein NGB36_17620 [Streptomyces sp. RB6PN25]|uniref:Ferric oxidoreductase domain-containing protein n=1 Tax=Streptomyces humicola TaxID=2953240 RepID=A0ABT1PXG3_9ACTN|nr:hypothetical protein [Streptomyces humicola]MCQ4082369.1 hypothetical protein [Streptomyces humicola]